MPYLMQPAIAPGTLSRTPQPTLRTADGDLVLRPFEPEDAAAIHAAFQDPVLQHWHIRTMDSADEAGEWLESVRAGWHKETCAQWLVVRAADGEPLGRMALRSLNLEDGVAEVGYWVMAGARGLGVAPRALTAMTDWALAAGFHRIDLEHSTGNEPSCRVAEKAGYPLEGTRRSSALHADGWHDMHVHVRIRQD
ncbi:GNAT family N-acetyltransferase [Streptomyces sp. NPDC057694]|uniref:GNAT family N-acetyltransferase n=1 Tax=Streptomyces sp. NPDC057694 TaxID=3346216 RepID=UPI00367CC2A4